MQKEKGNKLHPEKKFMPRRSNSPSSNESCVKGKCVCVSVRVRVAQHNTRKEEEARREKNNKASVLFSLMEEKMLCVRAC